MKTSIRTQEWRVALVTGAGQGIGQSPVRLVLPMPMRSLEDVTGAVLFLTSNDAAFITGRQLSLTVANIASARKERAKNGGK